MKFLITGARGMLGSDFSMVLADSGFEHTNYPHGELDVRDLAQVRSVISLVRPEVVIHAAAFTNVDESERTPEVAYSTNTIGTWNVALACREADATLFYVSSCGIFDGLKTLPYNEFDEPAPLTHYHRSKYLGEQLVARHCPKHYVVRPGWLFGGSSTHRRNFVEGRRREALTSSRIVSASDKFGSPTYTVDVARQALELLKSEAFGTYHMANIGIASRYEYVRAIVNKLALPTEVCPVESDHFPRSAPVPRSEALENMCLKLRGMLTMRPWEDAMEEYIHTRLIVEVNRT